jgi:hypothetical protein
MVLWDILVCMRRVAICGAAQLLNSQLLNGTRVSPNETHLCPFQRCLYPLITSHWSLLSIKALLNALIDVADLCSATPFGLLGVTHFQTPRWTFASNGMPNVTARQKEACRLHKCCLGNILLAVIAKIATSWQFYKQVSFQNRRNFRFVPHPKYSDHERIHVFWSPKDVAIRSSYLGSSQVV